MRGRRTDQTSDDISGVLAGLFFPSEPVSSPAALTGRSDVLKRLLWSLTAVAGSVPILEGSPAVGKSSVLKTVGRLLSLDPQALEEEQNEDVLALIGTTPRLIVYIRCSRKFATDAQLCDVILERLRRAISSDGGVGRRFVGNSLTVEASVPFLKVGASLSREAAVSDTTAPSVRLAEFFRAARLSEIEQVVVLLDECEQLPWLESLVDFTRDFEDSETRFVIAVRSNVLARFINPEYGDYRKPTWIPVKPLGRGDIRAIVRRAQDILSHYGVSWVVRPEVITEIERRAGGQAWYVQMVGSCLLEVADVIKVPVAERGSVQGAQIVTRMEDFETAEALVRDHWLHGLHDHEYVKLCSRSPHREFMLRALATYPEAVIPRSFVAAMAKKRGLRYKGFADDLRRKGTLEYLERQDAYWFSDHQFRVYCRLSRPIHTGIQELVEQAASSFSA